MSYLFTPFLLSQWNLFPSTFLSAGKLTFPLLYVHTERLAVLSRSPVPVQSDPLPTILSVTSISDFCPEGLFVGAVVRLQKMSLLVKCLSAATTLDRPGSCPPMV